MAGHLTFDGLPRIVEIMAFRLAGNGGADGLVQGGIIGAGPQRRAQVGHVFLTQTHIQLAGAGQPDAVAAFAEIMRQRRDEADALAGFGKPDIAGGATGAVGQIDQREAGCQFCAQIFQRPVLIEPLCLAHIAHRHDLDKGQIVAVAGAPIGEGKQFGFVEAFQRHGVDFYLQTGFFRRSNAIEHLRKPPPAGDFGKFRIVQRVNRDVDPLDANRRQIAGVFAQLRAVGGQRQFLQRARLQVPRHRLEEGQDALAHKRLAAGDAQLFDAHADESGAKPVEFFQRQQIGFRQEGHVFGHAIGAAEIAAVGDRDAQVGDCAGERVYQGRLHHGVKVGAA
ncbi:MAG: hypothetical protein ACD_54C00842G0001, partial [uncultured bacterium]